MNKLQAFLIICSALLIIYSPVVFFGKTLQPALYQPHGILDGWPDGYNGRTPAATFNIDLATPAYYEWPINKLAGNLYKNITVPLWNPYQAAGTPLLAQYSTRVLFPYQVFENLSPIWTWDFFLLGRILIAGFFTYLFLELLGLSAFASLFGSVAYMFSGAFAWFINLEQFANTAMMLPVYFYCLERLVRHSTLRAAVPATISTGLILLAGQPEIAFLALFMGSLFFAFRVFYLERELVSKRLARFLIVNLLGLGIALPQVLPFIEFVNGSHHLHTAESGVGTKDTLKGYEALRVLSPTITETPQRDNRSTVKGYTPYEEEFYFRIFPDNGAWDRLGGYTGVTSVLVSLFGLAFGRDRRLRALSVFFFAFGLTIVLKNFGIQPFVSIGELPVFNQIWTQRWAGPVWTFCFSAAAAFGIESLRRASTERSAAKIAALFSAVLIPAVLGYAALSYLYLMKFIQSVPQIGADASFIEGLKLTGLVKPYFGPSVLTGIAVTALIVLTASSLIFMSIRNPRALYGLLPLITLELWWSVPRGYEPESIYLKLLPFSAGLVAALLASLGRWRLAATCILVSTLFFAAIDMKADKGFPERHDVFKKTGYVHFLERHAGNHRVVAGYGMLFPNYSSAVGIQDIRFINSLIITSFDNYKNRVLQKEDFPVRSLWFTGRKTDIRNEFRDVRIEEDFFRNLPHYSFLGVKYLVFPPGFDLAEKRREYINATGDSLPDFQMVYSEEDATVFENPVALPRAFVLDEALIHGPGRGAKDASAGYEFSINAISATAWSGSNPAHAEIIDYQPNLVAIAAYAPSQAILVLTDSFYTGWQAYVDGNRSEISMINGVVRGVVLEPGKHLVEFRYMPASFIVGIVAFLISCSAMLLMFFWPRKVANPFTKPQD